MTKQIYTICLKKYFAARLACTLEFELCCSALQSTFSAVQCSALQCIDAVQCSAVQSSEVECWCTVPWYPEEGSVTQFCRSYQVQDSNHHHTTLKFTTILPYITTIHHNSAQTITPQNSSSPHCDSPSHHTTLHHHTATDRHKSSPLYTTKPCNNPVKLLNTIK